MHTIVAQVSSTDNRLATLYEYVDDTEDYVSAAWVPPA